MKKFLSIPVQLLLIIAAVFLLGGMVPLSFIQGCYTFSVVFKELLSAFLPFMVFFFVIAGILSFQRNAPFILGVMLGCIFLSNGLVALLSYAVMVLIGPSVSCEIGTSFLAQPYQRY